MSALDDLLNDLRDALRRKREQLQQKKIEKQGYLNTAADIKNVYNRMKSDKGTLKDLKTNVKTFSKENYTDFKGDLFTNIYNPKLSEILSSYDDVISRLDYNMDELNWKITEYENKALSCDGPISILSAGVNSLINQIENWFN